MGHPIVTMQRRPRRCAADSIARTSDQLKEFILGKMFCIIVGSILLAGCAAPSSGHLEGSPRASASLSDTKSVASPTLNAGDIWVDRIRGQDREFRIVSKRDDGTYEVSFWGTQMITDKNLNLIIDRSLTEEGSPPSKADSPRMWFAFPLYAGKSWKQTYHWQSLESSPTVGTTEMVGNVVGWERVTVPGGTFDALRVEVSNRSWGKGSMHDEMKLTYWYAPEVKRFVKFDYQSTWEGIVEAELVAYKPAAAARTAEDRDAKVAKSR